MQKERDYLQSQLETLRKTRSDLPGRYDAAVKEVDQHIERLMESAGILGEVRRLKSELVKFRDSTQRQADLLGVKIEVMEHLFDTYHRDPVEEGEMLYGIDLSKLDWQTRLMVRSGNMQTIKALGGDVSALFRGSTPSQEDAEDTVGDVVVPSVDQSDSTEDP